MINKTAFKNKIDKFNLYCLLLSKRKASKSREVGKQFFFFLYDYGE